MIRAALKTMRFTNGLEVELGEDSIVVVIGPNNSGKSATLNSIRAQLYGEQSPASPLDSIQLNRISSPADLLEVFAQYRRPSGEYSPPGHSFHETTMLGWWSDGQEKIGPFLAGRLLSDLTTRARLGDCDPQAGFDARVPDTATHPFQHMYRDPLVEQKISQVFRKAFKRDLLIHRGAGNVIPAYVGESPKMLEGEDRISRSYLERIEALDPLEKQGDGVRSFVSIVARVITENRPIQLIDEPEAFLHPPQAKMLAESIASLGKARQTIIATHHSGVLQGLLGSGGNSVSVIRLSRHGSESTASYLQPTQVMKLWRDPILRFGNVLDGLFHEGVVITEADADCKFYEALIDLTTDPEAKPDIHYTYSGGKDRLPVVISALIALGVPVATIVDFDVLNNDQPLRRIVEAHGGDWALIESDWKSIKAVVETNAVFLGADKFKAEMSAQLKQFGPGGVVPKEVIRNIKNLARQASAWDSVKSSGVSAIPPGEPTVKIKRLLANLKKMGIFVSPQGEMEGFCRSLGGHGPRWVEAVLQRDLANDEELQGARFFAQDVVSSLRVVPSFKNEEQPPEEAMAEAPRAGV